MSLVVVLVVAGIVFMYVRATRRARQAWVSRLALVGRWRWEGGQSELVLNGAEDHGRFTRNEGGVREEGEWRLRGHTLELRGQGTQEDFDLQYFQPGSIGLQGATGERRVYAKDAGNVVSLQRTSH